jgi:hypothetical protein
MTLNARLLELDRGRGCGSGVVACPLPFSAYRLAGTVHIQVQDRDRAVAEAFSLDGEIFVPLFHSNIARPDF